MTGVPVSMRWLVLSFAGLGATAATVPSMIPAVAEGFGVDTTALSPAVPALFAGVLLGVLLTPIAGRLLAPSTLVRAGAIVQATALLLVAVAPTPAAFVAGAGAAGLGFGLVEAAGTASARLGAGAATPRLLVRLTLAVAALGTLTPIAVLATSSAGAVRAVPVVVALLQLLAALQHRPRRSPGAADVVAGGSGGAAPAGARVETRGAALPALGLASTAIACYVGVETILSGWSATIVAVELGADPAVAALGTSAFWLLISLGRLAGVLAGRRLPAEGLGIGAAVAVALAVAGAAVVTSVSGPAGVALLAVAVFFAGPCYAIMLGLGLDAVSSARSVTVASVLVAVGAVGGVVVPSIAAVLDGETGSVPVAPAAGAAALMLAALVGSRMLVRRSVSLSSEAPA
ncbi:hypothetical protein [Herbiconiux flava]|uniref:Fucose permease n=1 Tax=Herbiconiux flava TaxID=881268 RepID=A0A852SLL7_9MICO|nr:hypothetical protein [Herbiconiux flava]NYD69931.1 fucose permease [Herbiconiux flava]